MTKYGFIGLGLIGGSIARAIKKYTTDSYIIAYDVNTEALMAAKDDSICDEITQSIDDSFSCVDYLFLCAPVQKNDENLSRLKGILSKDCLITDVGSVKGDIHRTVHALGLDAQFIGGHPMAGSERIGYLNSKAMLLQNAYYILTPTVSVPEKKLQQLTLLVKSFGAIPLVLTYEEHDFATAAISHLPHVISASLVELVKDHDTSDGLLKMIAAGGFKDITRISSSSPVMWQQICLTNTENIQRLLREYIISLTAISQKLEERNADDLYHFFEDARVYRDSFIDSSSGPIKRSYVLKIDIADEPGALASIATILALNSISIKNIGIAHNREYEGGVLQLELYEEDAIEKAKRILSSKGYTIYEKT